jgi:hypothetical protein
MNKPHSPPSTQSPESKVYEVREFIRFKPSANLVPVRHYRTVYHRDGRISKEALSVEALLERTIEAFDGLAARSAGALTGFFKEVRNAEECAEAIVRHHGRPVEVTGSQVTISI